MKKIFTLICMAMIGIMAFAQEEEDVTSYIVNSGFDEDLTWQADGSPKAAVAQDYVLSSRSYAWLAADSSVYCLGRGTRGDGCAPAWNGFVGQIKGWTVKTGASYYPFGSTSPEWVYFGSVAYGMAAQGVPIADDGTTFLETPEKPDEDAGEDNVGALYLRAGWGGSAAYKQTVKLPCAQYRLDYWIYNANYAASSSNTGVVNLCKVTCRKDVFEDTEGFNAQTWTKHSIEFTPTTDFEIQFGFTSSGGSGSNPFLFIDGIKLYRIGEADEAELLAGDMYDYIDSLDILMNDEFGSYEPFQVEIGDQLIAFQDIADGGDVEEMRAGIESIKAYLTKLNNVISQIEEFNELMTTAYNIIEQTEENPYPGIGEFSSALEAFETYQGNGYPSDNKDVAPSDYITLQLAALQAAINAYRMSQEASEENPANYSFMIQHPEFLNDDAVPTYDADLVPTYPNIDSYTQGSAPSDGNSTGWQIGSSGGDQRLNFVQGRACWNAWRNTASFDEVRLYQELTDIPNGYYKVSALMITQEDCISDQHIYATSSVDSQVSPVLPAEAASWNSGNSGESTQWGYLTTEKVLVSDGTLTIGALGHGTDVLPAGYSDYRQGWFCVTHFVLEYLGEAGDEAFQLIYDNKIQACDELAAAMGFQADKKAFLEVVDANRGAVGKEACIAALAVINEAYATAQASQTEYEGVLSGTYAGLQDSIQTAYPEGCKAVAQAIVDLEKAWLESAEATYTESGAKTTILRYYRDNLLPALKAAEAKSYTDAQAAAVMAANIKIVVDALSAVTEFPTTAQLDEYIALLSKATTECDAAEAIAQQGINAGDDYTFMIANPTIENTSASTVPTGWTVEMSGSGNGYVTNVGQQYNGDTSGYYLDAWNGTAGNLLYNAYQTINNLPNGTYMLAGMVRTSGDTGMYMYATTTEDKSDIQFAPVKMETFNYTKYMDSSAQAELGGDSIQTVSDTRGSIWESAVDQLAAAKGITGPQLLGDGTYYDVPNQIIDAYIEREAVPEELQDEWDILSANSNAGRGWHYSVLNVEVTNHTLTFGVVTDSTFTAGYKDINGADCAPFTGTWISADNFELTLSAVGDNTGWSPVTRIEEVQGVQEVQKVQGIYNLAGMKVDETFKGIVIKNGKKVLY